MISLSNESASVVYLLSRMMSQWDIDLESQDLGSIQLPLDLFILANPQ